MSDNDKSCLEDFVAGYDNVFSKQSEEAMIADHSMIEELRLKVKSSYDRGYQAGVSFGIECGSKEVSDYKNKIEDLNVKHKDEISLLQKQHKDELNNLKESIDSRAVQILEKMNEDFTNMKDDYYKKMILNGDDIGIFIKDVVKKILGFDMNAEAAEWLRDFINDKFLEIAKVMPLEVKINSEILNHISELKCEYDNINFVVDNDKEIGECELLWDSGKLIISKKDKMLKLQETLDNYIK